MSEFHDIPEQTCCPESLQKIPDCKDFDKIYEHKIRLDNHKGHSKKEMCSASFMQGTVARLTEMLLVSVIDTDPNIQMKSCHHLWYTGKTGYHSERKILIFLLSQICYMVFDERQ